jgi:hypothetical protein
VDAVVPHAAAISHTHPRQEVSHELFEDAGSHMIDGIVVTAAFQDDRIDPLQVQQIT